MYVIWCDKAEMWYAGDFRWSENEADAMRFYAVKDAEDVAQGYNDVVVTAL